MANVEGYWGPVTANIDWCESNYAVTYYIAEFWNTITSLAVIIPPVIGASESWQSSQVEFKYVVPFISMALVGCGTVFFHMGLVYRFQLLDEMPMIWGTAPILYAVQFIDKSWKYPTNFLLAIFLFICCTVSTACYMLFEDRLIFEISYLAMISYSATFLGMRAFRIDRSSINIFTLALIYYAVAFIFWLIDRTHCNQLQAIRNVLPWPMRPLTEFHAIWHIFAAMGTYSFIMLIYRTRLSYLSKNHQLTFRFGFIPYYRYAPNATKKEN